MASKYINPFTDFGFKRIFGEESNKDLLLDFLNELLNPQGVVINELNYKKNDYAGFSAEDRKVIFDLHCTNENGDKFTIELQKAKQTHFKDRMLYYSSFSVQEQGIKGNWDYKLKAVYIIAILDFVFETAIKNKVVSYIKLLDLETNEVFSDKLNFVTIEMPHFTKEEHELETNLDKWFYLLRHLHEFENRPIKLQNKILEKVLDIAQYAQLTSEEKNEYEDSLKTYNDLKNTLDTAENKGYLKAEELFLPQIEEALLKQKEAQNRELEERKQKEEALLKQEEAQNREKETLLTLKNTILNLQANGFDLTKIASILGKSEAEILTILKV